MDIETTIKLTEAYKRKEVLWNPTHPNYYNRSMKKDAWDALSAEFKRPVEDVKKKMEYLLAGLRRERKKMTKTMTTGQGADGVYKSSWFAYPHLLFLMDKTTPRQRLNTEDSITEECEGETESPQKSTASRSQDPENDLPSPSSATEFTPPPIPNKKAKRTGNSQKDPLVMEALQLMRTTSARVAAATSTTTSNSPDSFEIYANYLASKFRTYSRKTFISVEHKINNILYCADSGQFDLGSGLGTPTRTPSPEVVLRSENSLCVGNEIEIETSPDLSDTEFSEYENKNNFSDLIKFKNSLLK